MNGENLLNQPVEEAKAVLSSLPPGEVRVTVIRPSDVGTVQSVLQTQEHEQRPHPDSFRFVTPPCIHCLWVCLSSAGNCISLCLSDFVFLSICLSVCLSVFCLCLVCKHVCLLGLCSGPIHPGTSVCISIFPVLINQDW